MCIRFLTTEIDGFTHSFVDGGVGYKNPTLLTTLLLKEHPFDYKVATDKLIMVLMYTLSNKRRTCML
jgi:patatin-like phospholipase/acyl hydrolase